jgi:hypothetical protein
MSRLIVQNRSPFLVLKARRLLGADRIPWRPAFSSHLIKAVIVMWIFKFPVIRAANWFCRDYFQLARHSAGIYVKTMTL